MRYLIALYIVIISLMFFGWIRCIYKFVHTDFKAPYKAELIYGFGSFSGTGVVIGFFNITD